MPLPAAVRIKLRPLLAMLSSDTDGERLAATAAIDRTLKANALDWHDLAGAIVEDPPSLASPPPPPVREPRLKERGDGKFEIPAGDLLPLVTAIRENLSCDNWTDEFLASMESRAVRWDPVILSEKQVGVLVRLLGRIS